MLSIAVCDDEILEQCKIAGKVEKILGEMKVSCTVRQFGSGEELLQAVEDFDIIFLDILMLDMDGMETARLFREKNFDKLLIFVSSSREYILEAYDVEAFHYLLKPIEEQKLKMVLQRAVQKMEHHVQEFIIASRERQKWKLYLDYIYYFEIKGRVIEVHGTEGLFTYYGRIGMLENTLQDKGFFRCHKSYLVNLKAVSSYNRQELTLDNGEKIVIARRRYEEFSQKMLEVMRKSGGIV